CPEGGWLRPGCLPSGLHARHRPQRRDARRVRWLAGRLAGGGSAGAGSEKLSQQPRRGRKARPGSARRRRMASGSPRSRRGRTAPRGRTRSGERGTGARMLTDARVVAIGLFHDRDQARNAIEALQEAGLAATDVGLLTPNPADAETVAEVTEANTKKGAVVGAGEGGVLGGLLGWLGPIGVITIPGLGPAVAASVLLTGLSGALVGAGLGALAGHLRALGVPYDEAEWCEREVRKGATLVTVRAS